MMTVATFNPRQRQEWPHLRNLYLAATREELAAALETEFRDALATENFKQKAYHVGRACMFTMLIREHDAD